MPSASPSCRKIFNWRGEFAALGVVWADALQSICWFSCVATKVGNGKRGRIGMEGWCRKHPYRNFGDGNTMMRNKNHRPDSAQLGFTDSGSASEAPQLKDLGWGELSRSWKSPTTH